MQMLQVLVPGAVPDPKDHHCHSGRWVWDTARLGPGVPPGVPRWVQVLEAAGTWVLVQP